MNKYIRLIFIRIEKQKIQKQMGTLWHPYLEDDHKAVEEMTRLQEQYNKLYREEKELRKDE